ncbi:MAG: AAA family ATPase [Actinomycetota bacterium]
MIYSFEDFELDTALYELRQQGSSLPMEPQVFDVLVYLVEHRDRVISKQELFENVWKTRYVTESALTSRIKAARRAVGDDGRGQRVIGTSHGRGYRFLAPVKELAVRSTSSRGEKRRSPRRGPASDHFVGRHDELEVLLGWLDEALMGARRTVVVTGEAGLGKTTLIEAFLDAATKAHDLTVAESSCLEQQGVTEPFMPLLDALNRLCRNDERREAVGILASHAPTWLAEMPWLVEENELEVLLNRIIGSTRTRMLREIVEASATLAARHPLILVLDDLQWSDPSTLDAVSALARSSDSAPVLFLCSCRTSAFVDPSHPAGMLLQELQIRGLCNELALPLLTEGQVLDYLRARVDETTLPEKSEKLVHGRTEGNPLFIKVLVDEWTAQDSVGTHGRTIAPSEFPSKTPKSLEQNIEQRLGRLSSTQQEILENHVRFRHGGQCRDHRSGFEERGGGGRSDLCRARPRPAVLTDR